MLSEIETPLDFEGVLADLLGRNGQWVSLSAHDADPKGVPTVLTLTGTLVVSPLDSHGDPAETFFCRIAEQPDSGAFISRPHFRKAGIETNGDLAVRLAGVVLTVGRGDPRGRP